MKKFKIEIPEGHTIDTENSNLEGGVVKFKKKEKYLNKQDIEDLGWDYDISFDIYYIPIDKESAWSLSCHKGNVVTVRQTHECRFHGEIKNKSELNKIMSMLGVK